MLPKEDFVCNRRVPGDQPACVGAGGRDNFVWLLEEGATALGPLLSILTCPFGPFK